MFADHNSNPRALDTCGSGNPIKIGWADKRDEHVVLGVIPNFTPQDFPPFWSWVALQQKRDKAAYTMENSV